MERPSGTAPTRERTVCPACLAVIETGGVRCPYCFADLQRLSPLPPEEVARHIEERERRRAPRQVLTRHRVVSAAAVALVALVAWWGVRTFVVEPGPLPLPSSTVRTVAAGPGTWPVAGGDLGGTRTTEASARLDGEAAWSADLGAGPSAQIVSDGERIFAPLDDGRLVALSADDGRVLWEVAFSNPLWAAPTVAGDLLVLTERTGRVAALDAATGEERWVANAQTLLATAPLVADGAVYVYGQDGVFGFDAEDGAPLWRMDVQTGWAFVDPVLDGGYLAVTTGDRLFVFDWETGDRTYWYEFDRSQPFAVAAGDGAVYAASGRIVGAFALDSTRPWWEGARAAWVQFAIWGMAPVPPPPPSLWVEPDPPEGYPAALGADAVFLASPKGRVEAIRRGDGGRLWSTQVGEVVAPPVLTAGGLLLVERGRLVLLDAATGAETAARRFEGEALRGAVVTEAWTLVATESRLIALR